MKNRKLWVSLLAGIMAFLMLFGLIAGVLPSYVNAESSSVIKEQLDALKEEKEKIQDQIKKLQEQLSDNMDQMEAVVSQKNLIDQEIFLLHEQVGNINEQISAYSVLIADKQDELTAAEAKLAELNEKNKERIRAMEENGSLSYWSVLFQANNFSDLLDRLKMVQEIAASDSKRLQEMSRAAQEVATAKETLETEKAALEAARAELDETQASLQEKRTEADALLADLVARGEEYDALLEKGEDDQAELLEQIAQKEKDYDSAKYQEWLATSVPETTKPSYIGPSLPESSSEFMVPCNYEWLSSPFGYRWHPTQGIWKMHYGVDLAAYEGTPIYASRGGVVTTATYGWSGGYYVTINHGDGFSSTYLHMTHYIVEAGDFVNQGQVIGYVGSTGDSSGPHLHFGISYNGTYVNPADYINFY